MVTLWKRKPVVIDPVTAPRAAREPLPDGDPCPNCGDCTSGNFCRNCGQARRVVHVSLREMAADFMDDQLALNSRLPVTLAFLLVRPGFLTREYLRGRIASYIRPLRLYLGTSVLFFVLFAWLASRAEWIDVGPGQDPARAQESDSARAARARGDAQAALARDAARRELQRLKAEGAIPPGAVVPGLDRLLADSAGTRAAAPDTPSLPSAGTDASPATPADSAARPASPADSVPPAAAGDSAAPALSAPPADSAARLAATRDTARGEIATPRPPAPPAPSRADSMRVRTPDGLEVGMRVEDPDSVAFGGMGAFSDTLNARYRKFKKMDRDEMRRTIGDALQEQLPRMMFAMLPIFALLLKFLYVRRGRYYVEHFIFSLHFHAFVFLLLTVYMGLEYVPGVAGSGLGVAVAGWMLLYLFIAMKTVYGQPFLKTAVKYFTLLWCYFFTLVISFLVTVMLWVYFL